MSTFASGRCLALAAGLATLAVAVLLAFTPAPTQAQTLDYYPPGTRTGVDAIDRVIAMVERQDVTGIKGAVVTSPIPCQAPENAAPGYPGCAEGEPVGTPVELFPFAACQPNFVQPNEAPGPVAAELGTTQHHLYAVYSGEADLSPSAAYTIFFLREPDTGVSVGVDVAGNIVSVVRCSAPAGMIPEAPAATYLAPPSGQSDGGDDGEPVATPTRDVPFPPNTGTGREPAGSTTGAGAVPLAVLTILLLGGGLGIAGYQRRRG